MTRFLPTLPLRAALLAGLMLTPVASALAQMQDSTPLIPRSVLFGNPVKAAGSISPDGKWLMWSAPVDGVMNAFVAPFSDPSKARQMTFSKDRPVNASWSGDSKQILYVLDSGGDENYKLYGVNVATGAQRTYTDFPKTRVTIIGASDTIKDTILVGLNNRDPRWHDVYKLNLTTGALTEVMKGDGYAGFMADDTLTLRLAVRPNAGGGVDWYDVVNGKVADKPFLSTDLENSGTGPAGFNRDGSILYFRDTRNSDTMQLFAKDMKTGKMTLIAHDPRADLGGSISDQKTGNVIGYAKNYLKPEWTFFDKKVGDDYAWLESKLGKGNVGIGSRTEADDRWVVTQSAPNNATQVYIFDRKKKKLTPFYTPRPDLVGAPLVAMHPVEIKARDGLTLPSYLSMPAHADANKDGVADHPVPLVLFVHGGPWSRDGYGYHPYHQWLTNRGYAVMSVNFRSSTGFGKKFITAGNMAWHKGMLTDLHDAVDWAVANGVTTPDKVAIMGGSYGGYATLAGLAFSPDKYACGVDIVGPSNLETLLATIPPYWEAGRKQFYARIGDPGTAEGLAVLRAASPLYKAGDIKKPLLIGQGANDPRVKQAESDQIVKAMQDRNIPVTYVLFPDEGHGFAKPPNNMAFNAITENFLAKCLGGRAEPIGDAVSKSSAKVVTGGQHVPGL